MKKNNREKVNKKIIVRRSISLALSFFMTVTALNVDLFVLENDNERSILPMNVQAVTEEDDPIFSHDENNNISVAIENLTAYSEACAEYHKYHQNDNLTILGSTGDTTTFTPGFQGLGTATYPFSGSVKIENNADLVLNLDAPLFNYVLDSVEVNEGNSMKIAREYSPSRSDIVHTTPILASHVIHDSENASASWNIAITQPSDNKDDISYYLEEFGGVIGTIEQNAVLTVSVTMDTTQDDTADISIVGCDALGFACGTLAEGSSLDFTLSATRGISGITTSSGNVGGLIGSIESGATFNYSGSNIQNAATNIKTDSGYAGGVAGSNYGTVTLSSNPYVIEQYIEGTLAVGGVYGYFAPNADATGENAIDTTKYSIDCRVNGNGFLGGMYGVLDSEYNITISGNSKITSNHYVGSAASYGGLIGQYKVDDISRTLEINSVTTETHRGDAATNYGGGIGLVSDQNPSYIKFDGFSVDEAYGADSLTFGGLVATADNAFIDANDITVAVDGTYKGGAMIGKTDHGVLRMTGYTTITNACAAEPNSGEENKVGQLVGYRDNALIFAGSGWTLNRCSTGVSVDDIGAWGEVLRDSSVLSVNETTHVVTVSSPSTSYTSIGNRTDFVISALNFQFDETDFLKFSMAHTDISSSDISITGDIDLSGTGITGLTRDNDISGNGGKCTYSGTISGSNNPTITLAIGEAYGNGVTSHNKEGNGKIYRHKYNGLVAVANNTSFSGIDFSGHVDVAAMSDMYVGTAAAQAKGTLGLSSVGTVEHIDAEVDSETGEITTNESGLLMTVGGSGLVYVGRVIGSASANISNITVSSCTIDGKLMGDNSAATSCFGGMIGKIEHVSNVAVNWNFSTVRLKGEVSNTAYKNQHIGGLISDISGYNSTGDIRNLSLNNVTVDGLRISGNVDDDLMGGLLGYDWLNTNVNIVSVDLANGPVVSMNGTGHTAGLVYRATGCWTVTDLDMTGINMIAPLAKSIGMIVNKGVSPTDNSLYTAGSRSAIYLLLPAGYSYALSWGAQTDLPDSRSDYVFDELCAYSSAGSNYIMRNGNGIVSINTSGLKMEDTAEDSLSYVARTTEGQTANPNTRYYYNLDITTASEVNNAIFNSPSNQLMSWGVNQYACQNIKNRFADCFSGTITDQTYDMKGYSWYPVSLNGDLTVEGTFKFYNKQFENCEALSSNTWSSLAAGTSATQHFMLHNGLIYDVDGVKTLTVGDVTLQGNTGLTSDGSGMLICGTVKGSSATQKVTVTVNGPVSLDGAYISGVTSESYAPLMINKVDSNSNLTVKNVSTTNAYQSMNSSYPGLHMNVAYPKAASSLIGNVGLSSTSSGMTVEFNAMRLDGRTTDVSDSTYNTELNDVYGTYRSIFTKATFLNQFMYESGSSGWYNFNWNEDWKNDSGYTHSGLGVTYGKEIGYTDADTNTEYPGEERSYKDDASKFVNPIDGSAGSAYSGFNFFVPYVAVGYSTTNKTHQIMVNHEAAELTGCGTYNDPYIMTGENFVTVAEIIKGNTGTGGTIYLPNVTDENEGTLLATDWHEGDHLAYRYDSGSSKYRKYDEENNSFSGTGYTPEAVRQYLARAYYSLTSDIELSSAFAGLGSSDNEKYYFRGVVIGNGYTITNKSANPFVKYSSGSVIKDVIISVDAGAITLNQNSAASFPTAQAYGAVIGQVLGGDNIIDGVSVSFTNTTITCSGTYDKLVPVGGYVGVIEKGGVYFRGMDGKQAEDIQGLTSSVASNVAEDNNKWMYVNPIIGRVINGFAVTESDAYRPYEKGFRNYNGSGVLETKYDSNGSVTMKNGIKHYSITDIDSELSKLDTNGDNGQVDIPNGQAFFVMSLIVNSGMSANSLGYNANNYQLSRWANYNDIGPSASNAAGSDYIVAHEDIIKSNTTDKRRGYLMHVYTLGDASVSGVSVNIILTSAGEDYILPDGYKGVGNIFNEDLSYHMIVEIFDGNGATVSQNTTYYYYPGYGTNSTSSISLDIDGTKKDANYDRYYQPFLPANASGDGRGGLGLFNYINNTTPSGVVSTFKDVKLTGSVKTDIIHYDTGEHIPYITTYLKYDDGNQRRILSAGSLVGCYNGNLTLNSVALDDVYVFGPKNTGGMIGYFPNNYTLTILNTEAGLGSDKITVESGLNAGGLVGKKQNGVFVFDNADSEGNSCTFNIYKVASLCTLMDDKNNSGETLFYNYGVGGLVGVCRGDSNAVGKTQPLTLKNFTMGSENQDTLNRVMCEGANIYTGGLFGIINRQYITMDNCTVYNMSVKSRLTAGGIVGQWLTSGGNNSNDVNCRNVISNTTLICNLDGAEISSTGAKNADDTDDVNNLKYCNAGGFVGSAKEDMSQVTIKNSRIEGYKISSKKNAGGVIGIWGDDSTKAAGTDGKYDHNLILNNISVLDCSIESDTSSGFSGGIVGRINSDTGSWHETYKFNVLGYNILAQNLEIISSASGYICGKMSNTDYSIIKIAGFSRQDTRSGDDNEMIQEIIGAPYENDTPYGNGGYVVFAAYDYNGKPINKFFSNIITSGQTVVERVPVGAKEITVDYTVIAQRDGNNNLTIKEVEDESTEVVCDIVPGLAEGSEYIVSSSGTRFRYELPSNSSPETVKSLDALSGDRASSGFYIYNLSRNRYFSNVINNNCVTATVNGNAVDTIDEASVWYFESVSNGKYKLYTFDVNGAKKYWTTDGTTNVKFSDSGDSLTVVYNSGNFFQMYKDYDATRHYYVNYSGGGGGFRYYSYTNGSVANDNKLILYYADTFDPELQEWSYGNNIDFDGSEITLSGTPTKTKANSEQIADYQDVMSGLPGYVESDTSYEVYKIHRVVKVNEFENSDNLEPYVTTSPWLKISSSQWLTGDGVYSPFYSASVFKMILNDISNNVDGRYDYAIPLTQDEQNAVVSHLSSSAKEFNNHTGIENFPLLVVDDTDWNVTTDMINDYLCMLTNTQYDFASDVSGVYEVGLHKCVWNSSTGEFDVDTGLTSGNLKREAVSGTNYFRMYADKVDTGTVPQFTLMDVKFFDPNDPTKIAYHLYVPVYVKKILQFSFNASFASNTDYYKTAYNQNVSTMFENLGNPVTLKFDYTYTRSAEEWAVAINGGDSVLTNYYKSLNLTNQSSSMSQDWPTGTRLVLIDAANSGNSFYMDNPPVGRTTAINLYDFYSDAARTQRFEPAPLNNLMSVTVLPADSENAGRLVLTDNNGTSQVYSYQFGGSNYTASATVRGTDGKYYAYLADDPDVTPTYYYVSEVAPKTGSSFTETYYLSIFTPKADSDTNIYHYEIASKESFSCSEHGADTSDVWRPNKIFTNQTVHLILGNLYVNNLTLDVAPRKADTQLMAADNNYLTVTMTASVELTDSAKAAHVDNNMRNNLTRSTIYQTFLMTYDMLETANAASEIGIVPSASVGIDPKSYVYNPGKTYNASTAVNILDSDNFRVFDDYSYIEAANNTNLIGVLSDSSSGYAVTLRTQFNLVYLASDLGEQFPVKADGVTADIGTCVIGYSNISSSKDSAAYSSTSDKKTDVTRYYTGDENSASLVYSVIETSEDIAGPYSYLGINPIDLDNENTVSFIESNAVYDTRALKNAGDYIELTFELSNKSNYDTYLPISSYLQDIKIKGLDGSGQETTLYDSTLSDAAQLRTSDGLAVAADESNVVVKVNSSNPNKIVIRVRKDYLQTTAAENVYLFPIEFNVKTGDELFNNNAGGRTYANYMVTLTAYIYPSMSSNSASNTSYATDHLIYTNARIVSDVLDENGG